MERVLIQFTGEQLGGIRRRARLRDASVSAIVREAVTAYLAGDERQAAIERALANLDGFPGGPANFAEDHDQYVDEDEG